MYFYLDPKNILFLLLFVSPLFITFFFILSSIFNQDVKAFVWFAGACLVTILGIILQGLARTKTKSESNCISLSLPLPIPNLPQWSYSVPSLSIAYLTYTLTYLVEPMRTSKNWNYFIIILFVTLIVCDCFYKSMQGCTNIWGILSGLILGVIGGISWYYIINSSGNSKLLYNSSSTSNNITCSKPKKQQFKCLVYKNGEIIGATSS